MDKPSVNSRLDENSALSRFSGESPSSDPPTLKAYTKIKQELARNLHFLRELFRRNSWREGENRCQELMVKLAEDHFTLAVLGQFNRGKSSLMNAILGKPVLPTGVLPLTSAITVLKFGPTERLVVEREGLFPEEAPLSQLADFVTQNGNPANIKKVTRVSVELPLAFLRRGFEFVDTPGVGSFIEPNTALTYGFLPKCDAAIFVTSIDNPLSQIETEFLAQVRKHVGKIFFVVNKTDLLAVRECDEVLEFIRNCLIGITSDPSPKLFPLSASAAFAAKSDANEEMYVDSGLKEFEDAVAQFISEERSMSLLASVAGHALQLLDDYQRQDLAPPPAGDLESSRINLTRLRDSILHPAMPEPDKAEAVPAKDIVLPAIEWTPEQADGSQLVAALQTRGCPVCDELSRTCSNFFARWQYELDAAQNVQLWFADNRGFCPLHTWQLQAVMSPQGISHAFPPLVEKLAHDLDASSGKVGSPEELLGLIPNPHSCRACQELRESERASIEYVASLLKDSRSRDLYEKSQGACLRHVGMLIARIQHDDVRLFLRQHAARRFERLAEDMQSYALKHDAVRRTLQNEDENDAYLRTITHVAGAKNLFFPWSTWHDGDIS